MKVGILLHPESGIQPESEGAGPAGGPGLEPGRGGRRVAAHRRASTG